MVLPAHFLPYLGLAATLHTATEAAVQASIKAIAVSKVSNASNSSVNVTPGIAESHKGPVILLFSMPVYADLSPSIRLNRVVDHRRGAGGVIGARNSRQGLDHLMSQARKQQEARLAASKAALLRAGARGVHNRSSLR